MTTATLSRRLPLPVRGTAARRGFLVGFGATAAAGILLLVVASAIVGLTTGAAVMPRVSVAGVELAGLDRAAAEARLASALPALDSGALTLEVDGREQTIAYAEVGRGYDLGGMLDAAFAVGRGGGPLGDATARLRALAAETRLPVLVRSHEPRAFERAVAAAVAAFRVPATDASVSRDGTTFSVVPAQAGSAVDREQLRTAVLGVLASSVPGDARIALDASVVSPVVATEAAEAAAALAHEIVSGGLTLELPGGSGEAAAPLAIDGETLAGWLTFGASFERSFDVRVDETAIWRTVNGLQSEVDREARSASFSLAGSGLGAVVPGEAGRTLDAFASAERIADAIRGRVAGGLLPAVPLAVEIVEPELSTEEAEAAFAEMELVSTWTTYYTPNDGNGYGANINIGAHDIDGRVLMPGEWFRFWDSIGPVTLERGYRYGGVIIGGRSVANGAIGGGICSTSTTIFNAALRAGLEMGDRLNHSYYIDRYPNGLDATVSIIDGWVQDMTFRNDTEHPIVIRGFGGNGFVRFDLWTVPSGRRVVLTDPVITNSRAAIETTQVDTSLAPGTSRRVEYPHHGHDASVTRYVYDAGGELIHQDHYFSRYRVVNGITLVGPAAPAPPPAPEPPPDEDDPGEEAAA